MNFQNQKNMKKNLFVAIGLLIILLTSCSPIYFQIYTVEPVGNLITKEGEIVYDDENFKVIYDLWSNGGDPGFEFVNKSDKNIYLNLAESFFIINGISYNYYKQRVFSNSRSLAVSTSLGLQKVGAVTGRNNLNLNQTYAISSTSTMSTLLSTASSYAYAEEKTVCIPPRSSKFIREYSINENRIKSCDLPSRPPKQIKNVKAIYYSKEQSPIVFRNRISYFLEKNDSVISFENEFYLKEVTNLRRNMVFEDKKFKDCGGVVYYKPVNKLRSNTKFYITYPFN